MCGMTLSFLPHFYCICLIRAISTSLSLFSEVKNLKLKFACALENIDDTNHGWALFQNLWFWMDDKF